MEEEEGYGGKVGGVRDGSKKGNREMNGGGAGKRGVRKPMRIGYGMISVYEWIYVVPLSKEKKEGV
jgi:hypothetical protein